MTISRRTKSREFAMQMLFQWEMSPQEPRKLEMKFWRGAQAAEDTEKFANQLFEATLRTVKDLDEIIEKYCENWRFDRLAAIDRAILRLAMHELALAKTPPRSVINEAIKLAKKYSSEDSAGFVNGILDAANKARAKSPASRLASQKTKSATEQKSG
jgi:transcription antitermination protein NusB